MSVLHLVRLTASTFQIYIQYSISKSSLSASLAKCPVHIQIHKPMSYVCPSCTCPIPHIHVQVNLLCPFSLSVLDATGKIPISGMSPALVPVWPKMVATLQQQDPEGKNIPI